jgi:hypothetical protein
MHHTEIDFGLRLQLQPREWRSVRSTGTGKCM